MTAGNVDETALYLTPYEEIDLSSYKLSDFENDLFYNKKIPFLTLTKSDFQEWVNPNGDIMYIYTGSPKIDWVVSKKDIAFTFSATLDGQSINVNNEVIPSIDFFEEITDDGESTWLYATGLFEICNNYDYKNWDAFLSKDEYTICLPMPPEMFEATTDLNIEIFRFDKKTIDYDALPELVGKNVTGTEYIINDESVIAGDRAEIFNSYEYNRASGDHSHAEGFYTTASDHASHAEGQDTIASGCASHAEGECTTASGQASHAEGRWTTASGDYSHAEGKSTEASGTYSHTEGKGTNASEIASHAEGTDTVASGYASHAEGYDTVANGYTSHAEGYDTRASGQSSHAEGYHTTASGDCSHAEGGYTIASGDYQHVQGLYNIDDGSYAHIVGNGSIPARSNAHTLDWSGNAWFAGNVYVGSTSGKKKDEGSVKLATINDLNVIKDDLNSIKDAILLNDKENGCLYYIEMRNGQLTFRCKAISLEVTTMPSVTTYMNGSVFDPSGMVITATAQDGSRYEVTDYTYDKNVMIGKNYITVYFEELSINIPVTINAFDPEILLIDFDYTSNNDGTYTITGWKETLNGEPSTEMIIPDNALIRL